MTIRATKLPQFFGGDKVARSALNHFAMHRVLNHNTIEPHELPVYQLAVVELGRLDLLLNGQSFTVPARHMLLIPPRVLIESGDPKTMNAGLFYWIGIHADRVIEHMPQRWAPQAQAMRDILERSASQPMRISGESIKQIKVFIDVIQDDHVSTAERFGASWQLAGRLCREMNDQDQDFHDEHESVALAIKLIKQNLSNPPTVDALADACGLHRSKFTKRFRESTGLTPRDYINRHRIHVAQNLLSEPGSSVTDTAVKLGFSSSQYFSSVFRKFTGTTPTSYQRERDV